MESRGGKGGRVPGLVLVGRWASRRDHEGSSMIERILALY